MRLLTFLNSPVLTFPKLSTPSFGDGGAGSQICMAGARITLLESSLCVNRFAHKSGFPVRDNCESVGQCVNQYFWCTNRSATYMSINQSPLFQGRLPSIKSLPEPT